MCSVVLSILGDQTSDLFGHVALAEDERRLGAVEDFRQRLEFLHACQNRVLSKQLGCIGLTAVSDAVPGEPLPRLEGISHPVGVGGPIR